MFTLSSALHLVFTGYTAMLFVRILGNWFPNAKEFKVMRFVHYYTEPYLKVFRKVVPPLGMVDLSPLLAFFALRLAETFIMRIVH